MMISKHEKCSGMNQSLRLLVSSIFFWLLLSVSAKAATAIQVLLEDNVQQVSVGSSTSAVVKDARQNRLGKIEGMNQFDAVAHQNKVQLEQLKANQLQITPQQDGYVWIKDRWYRGTVRLINQGSQLKVVNQVDLQDYLYSVVGAEMKSHWPLEALKAQAVAARSYAVNKQQQPSTSIYDLGNTTSSQVYKGVASETQRTHQAVNETLGEVLTYGNQVILAVFHSSSGGHTENVEDVWNRSLPYLRGVVDYDQKAPVYEWKTRLSGKEIGHSFDMAEVKEIIPQQTSPQGRVLRLRLIGKDDTKTISGKAFRQRLNLKSTLFKIHQQHNGDSNHFTLVGRGFGHGIGLSQWGANYLAQQGANYRQILGHYYQKVKLAQLPSQVARN